MLFNVVNVLIPIPLDRQCGLRIYLLIPMLILELPSDFNLVRILEMVFKYLAFMSYCIYSLFINFLEDSFILVCINFDEYEYG